MTKKLEEQQPKVAVFSVIRRWDHYVPRTIDSVVAQTYENWEWYIFTSPKSQAEIEAVTKDEPRIHLVPSRNFHCHCEDMTTGEKLSNGVVETAQKGDYFCVVDGDDRLLPDFMEYQLEFMLKHDLDISACGILGTGKEGELLTEEDTTIAEDLVIAQKDFVDAYPLFHLRNWTMWGRLSKSSLFSYELYENMPLLRSSNDAPITLPTLKKAKRIGLTKKPGYLYSLHLDGMSFQNFHPIRETEPFLLNEIMLDMLNTVKTNEKQSTMEKIQYAGQYCILGDLEFTMRALLMSERSIQDKIELFYSIYTNPVAVNAFRTTTTHKKFIASLQYPAPYYRWNHHVFMEHLNVLVRNFSILLQMAWQDGHEITSEEKLKLKEIFRSFAPEYSEKMGIDAVVLLGQSKKLYEYFFNLDLLSDEENKKKLSFTYEQLQKKTEISLPLVEIAYFVGEKLGSDDLIQTSLTQKLKFYQEIGDMEKTMAVMDEMIEKNIQFG